MVHEIAGKGVKKSLARRPEDTGVSKERRYFSVGAHDDNRVKCSYLDPVGLSPVIPLRSQGCTLLSEDGFESRLDAVCEAAAGSIEGVFGPASLTWRVDREAAVFLGAGRVAPVGAPLGRSRHRRAFPDFC